MNLDDDIIDMIDGDPTVTSTVDETLKNIKAGDIVSLSYYRHVMETYKGWKPVSMEEYIARLNSTQKQIIERELRKAREAVNKRVIRQNNLKK